MRTCGRNLASTGPSSTDGRGTLLQSAIWLTSLSVLLCTARKIPAVLGVSHP